MVCGLHGYPLRCKAPHACDRLQLPQLQIQNGSSRFAMRFLHLRRIVPGLIVALPLHSHPPKLFRLDAPALNATMADESRKGRSVDKSSTLDEAEATNLPEKASQPIPPPPERPLSGDCCGSGCVRCVWDVYREDLEGYKQLYK